MAIFIKSNHFSSLMDADPKTYFHYKECDYGSLQFVGNSVDEIAQAIQALNADGGEYSIPNRYDIPSVQTYEASLAPRIQEVSSLWFLFETPLARVDDRVKAHIRPNVTFCLNANMWHYMQDVVERPETVPKSGPLYHLTTGMPMWPQLLIPEDILRSVCEYDWGQHELLMTEFLRNRRLALEGLAQNRNLIRTNDVSGNPQN